jgi:hypothetical protein
MSVQFNQKIVGSCGDRDLQLEMDLLTNQHRRGRVIDTGFDERKRDIASAGGSVLRIERIAIF